MYICQKIETMNILKQENISLFELYSAMRIDKAECTNPYLVVPSDAYVKSSFKVLLLGKETNGWGTAEFQSPTIEDLEDLYNRKINDDWGIGGPLWDFYYSLRCISEGDNIEVPDFAGKVGFCASNIALIGKEYGHSGFNSKYAAQLSEILSQCLIILNPDIVLCPVGVGTSSGCDHPYIELLKSSMNAESCNKKETNCNGLYELHFTPSNSKSLFLGCRHPQGASNDFKENVKRYLIELIKQKLNLSPNSI